MTRVAVFVDYQNVYKGARRAFGRKAHFTDGQIHPQRLGLLLVDRGKAVDSARTLDAVHIFRGEPSGRHSPGGQAACQRQVAEWGSYKPVHPVTRPLKYYETGTASDGTTTYEAREKGIDVLIALAIVTGAMRDEFDTAVLFSGDTDLVPAIEQTIALGKRCEVASWENQSRLRLSGTQLWCHKLTEKDYDNFLHDTTDYTLP